MRRNLIVIMPLILALAFPSTGHAEPEKPAMKVGAVLSLTGDAAADGLQVKRGLELAAKDLAARGLEIHYTFEDDQTDSKQSLSATRKLLTAAPDALIGPVWSFLVDAAGPAIISGKVCTFSPSVTSEITSVRAPNLFFGTVKNLYKAEPAAEWLKNQRAANVAILVSDDRWGESHAEAFSKAAALAGAKVVALERTQFGLEGPAFQTVLLRALAKKPDALLWTGYEQGAHTLISSLHKLSLSLPVLATEDLEHVVTKKVADVRSGDRFYVLVLPSSDAFRRKFRNEYGEEPASYAENAYDGLKRLAQVFFAGKKTPARGGNSACMPEGHFDENNDLRGGSWLVKAIHD